MPFLIAAVVLVGAIATLNLLLTVGVIRRLREHTAQLADVGGQGGPSGPVVGDPIEDFTTTAVDETPVARADLDSYALVSVMSPGCGPCEEKLPKLVSMLEDGTLPKKSVLAVIAGDEEEAVPMVTALKDLAVVVREEPVSGAVQSAVGIRAYPTMFTAGEGKVASLVHDLAKVKAKVSAG
ncbi:TlpA family protein disulfide reductase [Phytomonospora endophytica]|uniref:Thioredoxin domain-containing protein n=1 Tax=Phytomonospora endophytica TaxID=714109 RepID=A0A841FUF3_9ACTN|nr:hypothetical protein [Phytomonospora endophytica]MBB6039414.1 hypothetical protein [Phytomonospora endophytica]GIG70141.1 TlpA family protein [Phytomonospora endophytica]